MLADIERKKKPLERTKAKIVGSTAVRLEGDPIQCRLRECNSGPISMGQVLTVQPFGNVIDIIKIKGQYIWDSFEPSVANYDPHDRPGAFLQISGARVVYNLQNRPGNRVVSFDVRCRKCHVPTYSPIEMEAVYDVLLNDWLIKAGDGYEMIKDNIIEQIELNSLDVDILIAYLKAHPRVFPEVEGRIKFVEIDEKSKTNKAPVSQSQLTLLFLGLWFVVVTCMI